MASTKQQYMTGEGLPSQIAGMSKNQLYDIMSQMKTLIEQNQQQARKILIDNPSLTKSLFQERAANGLPSGNPSPSDSFCIEVKAQIMLGMVRPPQKMPNIQHALPQQPQQSAQQQLNVQAPQLPPEPGLQGQASSSQPQLPGRQQYPTQPSIPMPPSSLPASIFHTQTMPSHSAPPSQQVKGPLNTQVPSMSFPQTSQMHNLPPPPPPAMQHPLLQSPLPMISNQTQHSIQSSGVLHQPLQPPLPPQPRPSSMQPFQHQLHSRSPHNMGFQPSGAPPQLLSQPMFHSNTNLPTSFPQGQPPLPNQPPSQHLYMGSSHLGSDFGNQGQGPTPMQVDRGAPWIPGLPDNSTGAQFQGPPPPLMPVQMGPGPGGQPPRPPQLTTDMEKALLQQVMSLTPEQINLLPPEQRQQVIQLQQILR